MAKFRSEHKKRCKMRLKLLVIMESKEVIKVRSKGSRSRLEEAPTGRVWTSGISECCNRLKYIK